MEVPTAPTPEMWAAPLVYTVKGFQLLLGPLFYSKPTRAPPPRRSGLSPLPQLPDKPDYLANQGNHSPGQR